jgi:hypothetical protein
LLVQQPAYVSGGGSISLADPVRVDASHFQAAVAHAFANGTSLSDSGKLGGHEVAKTLRVWG